VSLLHYIIIPDDGLQLSWNVEWKAFDCGYCT